MRIDLMKQMIKIIRKEEQQRTSLSAGEDPDFALDRWLFMEEPFINEMCLMLLVALRHQVERKLVGLAARASCDKDEISRKEYEQEVKSLKKSYLWDMKKIEDRLHLEGSENYKAIEALRLLANSYKHDPSMVPDKKLLELLNLDADIKYASLPESDSVREGLAVFVGLNQNATYCDIAEQFLNAANVFILSIEGRTKLSEITRGPISLNPKNLLH